MSSDRDNSAPSDFPRIAGFDILEMVGQGGMGAVYRAKQLSLDRIVALKILSSKLAADPKYTDSFLREARSAARLNHANIIPIYDAGNGDGHYYYTMEFIHGDTLQKWVAREGALPESTALDLTLCVANALKFAWDKAQLIHRDIKPDNIIVDTNGNVKLCDLGLAKYFGESTLLSLSGQVFGTPNYMSPEQARAEKVDCRTDIYALGLTLYYALTGNIPFHGGTAAMVMSRHMNEQLPDPRDVVPTTSVHVVRILEKMTSKKADDRYASWDDVIRDLQRAREGTPPQIELFFKGNSSVKRNTVGAQPLAPAPSQMEGRAPSRPLPHSSPQSGRDGARPSKSRQPILLALVAILCLALGGGTAWFFSRSAQNPNTPPAPIPSGTLPPSNPPNNIVANPPNPATQTVTTTTTFLDITPLKTYDGHTDRISGVAFTPDGKHAVTSSFDGTIKYWNLETGVAMRTFRGHEGWVWSVAISPDGKYVVSGGEDGTVRLWNELGKELRVLRGHKGAVRRVAFSPRLGTFAISAGRDGTARLWSLEGGREVRLYQGHSASVNSAVITPDALVITASQDKTLKIWERDTARVARNIPASTKNIWSVALSPDGRFALSCGEESMAKLWDLSTGRQLRSFDTRTDKVTAALFTPDARRVLTAGYDKTARLWDAETGRELAALRGHTDLIECAAISPDGQFALTGSADKTLKLWKLSGGEIAVIPTNPADAKLREQTIGTWERFQRAFGVAVLWTGVNVEFLENGKTKLSGNQTGEGTWKAEDGSIILNGEIWKVTTAGIEMESGAFLLKKIGAKEVVAPPIQPSGTETVVTPTPKGETPVLTKPWENSLGMKFVPVKGTDVLFSIWETRVQDFEAFVKETKREWRKPSFQQGNDHPAVNVSWEDAKAFCDWLTKREQAQGRLTAQQSYRLPTDAEWSVAVGLGTEVGNSPSEKSGKIKNVYPWGNQWPPPRGAGNYELRLNADDFPNTSPVSSFPKNKFGLHDMGGNVWEWCEDLFTSSGSTRVFRGASWLNSDSSSLLSSCRSGSAPSNRDLNIGFRCVLVGATSEDLKRAEEQARLEAERVKVLQAFGEFQKQFLTALSSRDYAGAATLAQIAAAKPELASQQERAEAFAAVAQRLHQFWTKGFPDALAQLKGREITVQGEKGVLTEVVNGELILEKKIGDSGVVETAVPLPKLTPEEIASLTLQAKPNDKETLLTLAWFFFAESNPKELESTLREAEKSGTDTKETRQVMEWLGR